MRKWIILAATVALSAVTASSIISQGQAAPAKGRKPHSHVMQTVQQDRAPAKNPLCNNGFEKGNLNWQEYYHCY